MRDYLQTVLFFSVQSSRRLLCTNPLLQNNRPVRRWTECLFKLIFKPDFVDYPKSLEGIPAELEAHRRLVSKALSREVSIKEIWPELRAVGVAPIDSKYWVCAPFSSSREKDFPLEKWVELFVAVDAKGKLPLLVLTGSLDQKDLLAEFRLLIASASPEVGQRTVLLLPGNLQEFIDLLAYAECVTTVDTAAAHAATALDCRTLIIFSGKHQGMFAPWVRSSKQCWLLPKALLTDKPWHASRGTGEVLERLVSILNS